MSTILDQIAVKRKERILAEAVAEHLGILREKAFARGKARDILRELEEVSKMRRAVIAEIKRKSPSKGPLAPNLDPAALALSYQEGGAFAISCLVEPDFFGGSLADLVAVRKAVTIPVLYKDFIVDPYQLWQAKAYGADIALLIVALLGEDTAKYQKIADEVGINTLIEVHDAPEMEIALRSGGTLIGINNRNLKTFEVSLSVTENLMGMMGKDVAVVAESGIKTVQDMERLEKCGAKAFLIGENFVTSGDPKAKLMELNTR